MANNPIDGYDTEEHKHSTMFMGKARWDKGGFLKVKKWKQRYLVLSGGSLYYYNKPTNFIATGSLELQHIEMLDNTHKADKPHVFALKETDKDPIFVFAASSEQEKEEWAAFINASTSKAPLPPPTNSNALKKGVKYALQSTMASSVVGRKIIKEAIPEDNWRILDALCSFLKQVKGEEVAKLFKKNCLKLGTKVALLHHHKLLVDEDLVRWRNLILKLGSVVVDFYQMPSILDPQVVTGVLNELHKGLQDKLTNKLTPNTMEKAKAMFAIISDEALIADFFQKKKWTELEQMAQLIRSSNNLTLRESI